jgi:hypothetical protein
MNREEHSQCVLCSEFLTNDSLNARNLHRHLPRHASLANKPLDFFERNLLEMQMQENLMKIMVTTSTKSLLASFEIEYLIAKNKKPHTTGDTLLLPAAIFVCLYVCQIGHLLRRKIHEDFMFYQPLTERTTGSDMFKSVNDIDIH